MSDKPYQTPQSDVSGRSDQFSELMIPLSQTKPWARLVSILGFVFGGLMVLGGLGMFAAGGIPGGPGGGVGAGIGLVYILFSLLYIVPSFFLFRFANAIGDAMLSNSVADLVNAMYAQKSFWKFAGIVASIMIIIAVLGVVAAIVVPMMAMR